VQIGSTVCEFQKRLLGLGEYLPGIIDKFLFRLVLCQVFVKSAKSRSLSGVACPRAQEFTTRTVSIAGFAKSSLLLFRLCLDVMAWGILVKMSFRKLGVYLLLLIYAH
jgi:hypothetical protein